MVAIGALDYMYGIITGKTPPPIEAKNEGADIGTIKQFAQETDAESQKIWKKLDDDINRLNTSYKGLYGKSVFSDAYQSDLKQFENEYTRTHTPGTTGTGSFLQDASNILATFTGMPQSSKKPSLEDYGLFFGYNLQSKGKDYIFQKDHAADFDNKKTSLGQAFDDVTSDWSYEKELRTVNEQVDTLLPELIDSNKYYNRGDIVPHTAENTAKLNAFTAWDKEGLSSKIIDFLRKHPDKFNASTVSSAIAAERLFMKVVQTKWDDPNITKSIMEGDPVTTLSQFGYTGLKDTEEIVTQAADAVLDSDLNPAKPFYDFLKDLWSNAGTYIEYVIAVIVVVALLYLAGEIKYVAS